MIITQHGRGADHCCSDIVCANVSNLHVHFVLVLVIQSCPTPCDSMDCSPPGSSVPVHNIYGKYVSIFFLKKLT